MQKPAQSRGDINSCVVCLNRQQEEYVEKVLNSCDEDFKKKILARDFVVALIMKEILKGDYENQSYNFVCQQINAFISIDFNKVKEMHTESFMPQDVKRLAKNFGKIELNFILEDVQNQHLQQAINVFISSREPYSVKIFTTNKKLPMYYDLNGNIIECPHDFMRRDVNKFLELKA